VSAMLAVNHMSINVRNRRDNAHARQETNKK
jgi:hypothetical protein